MYTYLKRLKKLRKDAGLSQKQLAEKIYVSQSTMSKYESGKSPMTIGKVVALAKLYNVCVDYVIGLTDEKRSFGD